ncbi:MAG: pilus assembly protein [Lachnospiraceae bacterium]|nr:pilus assembly protein [Lachnospiraceae bacterium]
MVCIIFGKVTVIPIDKKGIFEELQTEGGDKKVSHILGKEKKNSLKQRNIKRRNGWDSIKRNTKRKNGGDSLKETLFYVLFPGSVTVEAALVLPIFIFATVTVLSLFLIMQTEYVVTNALERAVAETALLSEPSEKKVKNLTKAAFYKELAMQRCPLSFVQGNAAGFSWKDTKVDSAYIDALVTYRLKLPVSFLGKFIMTISNGCRVHRWTGYQEEQNVDSKEGWVFVTPNQSVYHISRDCSHLKLSVSSYLKSEWVPIRERYSPCAHCTRGHKVGAVVYLTKEGSCYHYRIDCSGLKRTVYMVKRSEVGAKKSCSRCGAN